MNTKHILAPGLVLSLCLAGSGCRDAQSLANDDGPPENMDPPPGMVWIPGGTFTMGTSEETAMTQPVRSGAEEMPQHNVILEGFFMDETEVTNAQFKAFVDATGYVTQAEKPFSQEDYPNARPEDLEPASFVFKQPREKVNANERGTSHWIWWQLVRNANWRQPEGPGSSIEGRMDHPVVCVSYDDCVKYAEWAGKRLPTEAEWEYAARGGLKDALYVWGNEFTPGGKWLANTYQGDFPNENTVEDGFLATAPVKSFPANGYGLFDMAGNVWEIIADPYERGYYARSPKYNPRGPENAPDMQGAAGIKQRIIRGGSFLCTPGYCTGYRPAARQLSDDISASHHTGFRCVVDAR